MGLRVAALLLLLAVTLLLARASANQEQYQWFLTQHYDGSTNGGDDEYCNRHMKEVMREAKRRHQEPGPIPWKLRNTIIHRNINHVRAICTDEGGEAIAGNLRHSKTQFRVTLCILRSQKQTQTSKTHTNPKYRATQDSRLIAIGCDEDNFPVHFDESWKPTTNQ